MKMRLQLGVALLSGLLSTAPVNAQATTSETPAQPDRTARPEPSAQPEKPAQPQIPAEQPKKPEGPVYVLLNTTMGDIVLELNQEKAPISTQNFVNYVEKKAYDGTIFHRVIPGFMIQGGGFTPDMVQKPTDKAIKNEWRNGLKNVEGSVAMARLGNRPDSATAQFFINVNNNSGLDEPRDGAGYAVFGKVIAGMDVVKKIEGVPTTQKSHMGDVPVEPITIKTARVLSAEEAAAARSGKAPAAGAGGGSGGR